MRIDDDPKSRRRRRWPALAAAVWIRASGATLFAQEVAPPASRTTTAADKSRFNLFNPTPRDAMREMHTDRPDVTESPYTVDAGHLQFELSFFDYVYDDDDGVQTNAFGVLPANIKVGLLNNVDIQFIFTPYEHDRFRAAGRNETSSGFGDDTEIRLKTNLWGNDGGDSTFGDTAFGVMPFIKFPTGTDGLSNDRVEGGLILPLAFSLPGDWDVGVMAEFDFDHDDTSDGYGVNFVHTLTADHDVPGVKNLRFYVEYVGVAPHETSETYQAIASGGFTYQLTSDWTLDCGGTAGVSKSADDFSVFVGTSFRF